MILLSLVLALVAAVLGYSVWGAAAGARRARQTRQPTRTRKLRPW